MSTVRRVVTGVGPEGRSFIVSDGPTTGMSGLFSDLWPVRPDAEPFSFGEPPGGLRWCVLELPPDEVVRKALEAQPLAQEELRGDGFHRTETIDFVMVLEGDLTL